jgi:hypothetical protein
MQVFRGSLIERASRESSTDGYRHPQVPDESDVDTFPYRDYDSDSDFSDDYDPRNPDDLEEEEKALMRSYLHGPPLCISVGEFPSVDGC